jgi:hypothetical protein
MPIQYDNLVQRDSDRLCRRAEALLADPPGEIFASSVARRRCVRELIADGYAHALLLDVDRRKYERQLAHLARSATAEEADQLRDLSDALHHVQSTSAQLRALMETIRARFEPRQ